MRRRERATAFAPATVANVAVGFDILGFAVDAVGDVVTVSRTPASEVSPEISIESIEGTSKLAPANLPMTPGENCATAGLVRLLEDRKPGFGFTVRIRKGIALGSGMGGSAASAVAAVVAANALLPKPLSVKEQLHYALIGEAVASRARHADNAAPCLLGGLQLVRSLEPLETIAIPVPLRILCVLVHPHLEIQTRQARAILKPEVSLQGLVTQSANLGGFLLGCQKRDFGLIRRSLRDELIEPQRAHLIPGFADAKQGALKAGALGFSISGSGPSVFAWTDSMAVAKKTRAAITKAFKLNGLECDAWITPVSRKGARLVR